MQVIPSRLKSHYDECANKELELANANVSDDNGVPEPNTNHHPAATAVIKIRNVAEVTSDGNSHCRRSKKISDAAAENEVKTL